MTMSTSERQPNRREDHLTDAELNELVDGTLAGRDLDRARAHLADCQECDARYRTLQATVSALREAPSVMPRRTFQLTPEQAKLPEKKPSWLDRFAERLLPGVPAIKVATVAVALLLVSVTAFDVLTNQTEQSDSLPQTSVQREADVPAPENTQPALTDIPVLEASDETISEASDADTALQESETGGAQSESDAAADDAFVGSAMQEAPPAPAAAVEQPTFEASPTPEPTATPSPTATPEPTITPTATPTPEEDDSWRAEITVSWWRIAELGLLLLLVWLVVSWVGRSRVGRLDE